VDIALIALLTFLASGVGTLTGFGTSTIMVPVMASSFPLPQDRFRTVIAIFLGLVALKLLVFP
jgi:uncharacterized membrane protein YfcA